MIQALLVILLYQLLGELMIVFTGLPLPGPLMGMGLLFLTLLLRRGVSADLQLSAQTLIRFLPLMFVPVGVGVLLHLGRVAEEWLAILVALVLSTVCSVVVTAVVMSAVLRFRPPRPELSVNSREPQP